MRIPRTWVEPMAKRIVDTLFQEELIVPDVEPKALTQEVEAILMEELTVEDRLNDEVRKILEKYEREFQAGRADYRKMFELTKKQLIKDKGVII
jgi:hypothetical protein